MKQLNCPNCGSRTTDFELESYSGRCIKCRQLSTPPLPTPRPEAPADLDVCRPSYPLESQRARSELDEAIDSAPAEYPYEGSEPNPHAGALSDSARGIGDHRQFEDEAAIRAGKRNMLFGALWCLGGLIVTLLTFAVASGSRGGTYVVAWGAILFGGIQFVRGMMQCSGGRSES